MDSSNGLDYALAKFFGYMQLGDMYSMIRWSDGIGFENPNGSDGRIILKKNIRLEMVTIQIKLMKGRFMFHTREVN